MRVKKVMTWSPSEKTLRLLRVMWENGTPGKGGYSVKLSLALVSRFARWERCRYEWALTLAGVRLHYRRSYGGKFV
ncbi:MAG TPA: hypothetical protein DD989_22355 [Pseudomonas sp.]|nr:hypothetical protein [Pseudomonas sp.]